MFSQSQPGDDIVDLRDVEKEYESAVAEADHEYVAAVDALKEQFGNWALSVQNNPSMISDRYFEDYARDFAVGIGAIERDAGWPVDSIDWEEAASDLQMDYSSVTFGDTEYWVR